MDALEKTMLDGLSKMMIIRSSMKPVMMVFRVKAPFGSGGVAKLHGHLPSDGPPIAYHHLE